MVHLGVQVDPDFQSAEVDKLITMIDIHDKLNL